MISIIAGSFIISLLHAIIPNHWLPVLAIGRKENWDLKETERVTFISGLAHVLSTIVTNPFGDGWYDRFGLENADKCQGKFGETYTTANGARANIMLGQRDFLVSQNWVNDGHGRCALSQ